MTIITEADFRRQIKSGLSGGYLFFGEEDYLKQLDLAAAREAISPEPALAFFNDLSIDALNFTPAALLDALMPLPMGAERKIVSVTGLSLLSMKPSELEGLYDALAALREYDYNVLILSVPAGFLDPGYLPKRPSALLKKLGESLTLVHFERSTPARLAAWCERHFAHNGVTADRAVCDALIAHCGQNMYILSSEVDKLSWYTLAKGRTAVAIEDVRSVAIASAEYDAFAFANALMEGKNAEALDILSTMRQRRIEPIVILSEVTRVFCDLYAVFAYTSDGRSLAEIQALTKMHEYKLRLYQRSAMNSGRQRLTRALALCAEADAILKQSPQGYTAIERLISAL